MMGYRSFLLELLEVYYHKGGKEVIESMPEVIRKLAEENRTSALMNEIGAPTYYYPDDVTNYDEAVDYLLEIAEARVEFMDKLMSDYAAAYRFDKG